MSTVRDWLIPSEQEFALLGNKWIAVFQTEGIMTKYGWTVEDCTAVGTKITAYQDARKAYETNNSSANRRAKDAAKKTAAVSMRQFANTFVRYNPMMDDEARASMGIRIRDTTPTVRPRPASRPETVVENTKNRLEHCIKALSSENLSTSKPDDAYGVKFAWKTGGDRPVSGEDLTKTKFSRKTSFINTFTEADKGKLVYYATCYENSRGEAGPWSLLVEAYIN